MFLYRNARNRPIRSTDWQRDQQRKHERRTDQFVSHRSPPSDFVFASRSRATNERRCNMNEKFADTDGCYVRVSGLQHFFVHWRTLRLRPERSRDGSTSIEASSKLPTNPWAASS